MLAQIKSAILSGKPNPRRLHNHHERRTISFESKRIYLIIKLSLVISLEDLNA